MKTVAACAWLGPTKASKADLALAGAAHGRLLLTRRRVECRAPSRPRPRPKKTWPHYRPRRLKRGRASGKQPDCATKREALSVCYRGAARSGVRLLAGRTMPRFEQPEWRDLR